MEFNVFLGNDTLVQLKGLWDKVAGAYENAATVDVRIKDTSGNLVAGAPDPLNLPNVAQSNGDYQAVLDKAVQIVLHTSYVAEIIVAAAGGIDAQWSIDFTAKRRTS